MKKQTKILLNKFNLAIPKDTTDAFEALLKQIPNINQLLDLDFSYQTLKKRNVSNVLDAYDYLRSCYLVYTKLGKFTDFEKVINIIEVDIMTLRQLISTINFVGLKFLNNNIERFLKNVVQMSFKLKLHNFDYQVASYVIEYNLYEELFSLNSQYGTEDILIKFVINHCGLTQNTDKEFIYEAYRQRKKFNKAFTQLLNFKTMYPNLTINKWVLKINPDILYIIKSCPELIQEEFANKLYNFVDSAEFWYALSNLMDLNQVINNIKTVEDINILKHKILAKSQSITKISLLENTNFSYQYVYSTNKLEDIYTEKLISLAKTNNQYVDEFELFHDLLTTVQSRQNINTNVGRLSSWTVFLIKLCEALTMDATTLNKFKYLKSIGNTETFICNLININGTTILNGRDKEIVALYIVLKELN